MSDDSTSPNPADDEHQLVLDTLVQRCAVATGNDWNLWHREAWPEEIADDPHWPLRLMDVARRGDELWWYCSPPCDLGAGVPGSVADRGTGAESAGTSWLPAL